mmetsp:Transcript_61389/g.105662  ORF Transcript_61389/g.105662 Transcript_61389/m.105662 type:complete len:207 (-) Transcript_61389:901-1521(-)
MVVPRIVKWTQAALEVRDLFPNCDAEISTAPVSPGTYHGSGPSSPAPLPVIEQSFTSTAFACGSISIAEPWPPRSVHRVSVAEESLCTDTRPSLMAILHSSSHTRPPSSTRTRPSDETRAPSIFRFAIRTSAAFTVIIVSASQAKTTPSPMPTICKLYLITSSSSLISCVPGGSSMMSPGFEAASAALKSSKTRPAVAFESLLRFF